MPLFVSSASPLWFTQFLSWAGHFASSQKVIHSHTIWTKSRATRDVQANSKEYYILVRPSRIDDWKEARVVESRLQASRWIVVDWMLPEFCVYQFISLAFSSSCSTFVYYFIQSRSALLYQQSHRPHHHHRESIHVFRGFVCTTQWSLFSIEFNTHTTFPFHWKIHCEPHKHYDHRLSSCRISYLSLPAHISSIHDDDQFIYGSWINIHMSLVHSP